MTDTSPPGAMTAVPDNIRAELARKRITEEQAADRIGIGRSTWQRWMAKPGYWRLVHLQAVAELCSVDLEALVKRSR